MIKWLWCVVHVWPSHLTLLSNQDFHEAEPFDGLFLFLSPFYYYYYYSSVACSTTSVTLGSIINHLGPQFPYLQYDKDTNIAYLITQNMTILVNAGSSLKYHMHVQCAVTDT